VLYEIDQPKVLEFKAQTLAQHEATPSVSRYVAVPVDLRQDWPKALGDAGFDATQPTAWAAEGLLPYLPAAGQDLLFEQINELSTPGSRVGVESFGGGFFDRDYLASRREQMRRLREEAGEDPDADVPDTQDLWYLEDRTDVADWLTGHNWEVSTVEAIDLMARYGRWTAGQDDATAPRTVFIEGHLVC
jgi:methyltransferase (TIGR00027 family)